MNISIFKKLSKLMKFFKRKFMKTNWNNLRKTKPISNDYGWSRGKPIDRFYIEKFLDTNKKLIKGACGEISEARYFKKYNNNLVTSFKIFDIDASNKLAEIHGNLEDINKIPEKVFDCFICTQVLNFIYDFSTSVESLHKMLKPEGVLLLTVAGPSSHISEYDMLRWGDYWRFTEQSILKVCEKTFGENNVEVKSYGNVLTATSMLQGISSEELTNDEINYYDPIYPILITVVAKKI
jgi:SAM-dependent methyltransferase